MTLLQHVYAIKNLIAHGPASDDLSYSDRLIAHFLQVARARLIEQKIDKYHYVSDQSYQDWCASLELSNFHNCCNSPDLDCKVLKSVLEVPKFLNSRWGNHLKVMDLSGRVLPEIKMTQNRLSKYALVPLTTGWFMHNNHIYILNNSVLTTILVNALFNDPQAVHILNCGETGSTCQDFMDEEFPIDSDLVDPMYRLTLDFLIRSMQLPTDTENNSKDVEIAQAVQ